MNEQDNLSDYPDPKLYHSENYDFEQDGPFILDLAKELGGAVLELGCGTGRMTIPFAENRVEIVGLDVVPGMVGLAKQKSVGVPIEWVVEDVRKFQLGRKFRLIFESGSVFPSHAEPSGSGGVSCASTGTSRRRWAAGAQHFLSQIAQSRGRGLVHC